MALTISGTSNGKLGNLSLSANTGDILDSANTTFFGVDQWYMNANRTQDGTLTAWTRVPATDGGGNIGSAMTVSSGHWTFPTTGIWLCQGNFNIVNTATDNDNAAILWECSEDDFSTIFTNRPYAQTYVEDEGFTNNKALTYVFDCQDTSTHKFRFKASSLSSSSGTYIQGITGSLFPTWVSFIRLGDT